MLAVLVLVYFRRFLQAVVLTDFRRRVNIPTLRSALEKGCVSADGYVCASARILDGPTSTVQTPASKLVLELLEAIPEYRVYQ